MRLCHYLLLAVVLSSLLVLQVSAGRRDRDRDRSRGGRVRIRKKPKGGECERVKESLCLGAGLPYNRTRLPNVFGHSKQKLASRALQGYRVVIESGCSPYVKVFMCASFLPECPRRKREESLQPCRSLCMKAKRDCEQTFNFNGMSWPDELACEMLPEASPGSKRPKCLDYEPPKPEESNGSKRPPTSTLATITAPTTTRRATTRSLAPIIDRQPEDSMVVEGQGSTLVCHAEGALEYTWYRLDGPMPEDKIVSEMVAEGEAILVLYNLTTSDSGLYMCEAENDAGVAQAQAKIMVMALPKITYISKDVTLSKGDAHELACQASGSPEPDVKWERADGKRVLMRRNDTMSILALDSAGISDTGAYVCTASNSLGVMTESVVVKVIVPPRWEEKPTSKTANEGADVVLRCNARGTEPLNITWRIEKDKSNHTYTFADYPRYLVEDGKRSLRVVDVQPEDKEVVFHCDVINVAGSVAASAKIDVIEQWQLPSITSRLPNMTAFVGEDIRLTCQASGDPAPQVTWFLDEIAVHLLMDGRFRVSESGSDLRVVNVNRRDSGTYRCVAANVNGFKVVNGYVDVVEPSLRLTDSLSNKTVANGSTVRLACTAVGKPKPALMWFFNDTPLNATHPPPGYAISGGNLTVAAMTSREEGKYGCLLSNEFFVVSSVAMVTISRGVPSTPPAHTPPPRASVMPAVQPNRTNDIEMLAPSDLPSKDRNDTCKPCAELVVNSPPSCEASTPAIKPRRYDIVNTGLSGYFRGWVDVTGQGAANDYCRIIMTSARALESTMQLACALAGTAGQSENNYVSGERFDPGQIDTWFMKDEDRDGKDDYCRCVTEGPDGSYVYCAKAGATGFYGAPGTGETQYTFKASGDRRELRKCRKRKVDPFVGVPIPNDN